MRTKIERCPICGRPASAGMEIVDKKLEINRVRCPECGLIFFESDSLPEPVYDLKYNEFFHRPGDIRKAGAMAAKLAELVEKTEPAHLILEVGPGNGLTSFLLKAVGFHVEAIEMDLQTARQIMIALGINVHVGKFETWQGQIQYDLIYAGHVIEHSRNPLLFFKKAYSHLKDTGIFFIDTPYAHCARRWGESWKHFRTRQPYEHCSLFDIQTIHAAAKKTGFEVVSVETLPEFMNMHAILKKGGEHGDNKNAA